MELEGGSGTRCSHWDETCLGIELMTGYVNGATKFPLSKITIGSLEDMGYKVDYSKADSYGRSDLATSCLCNRRSLLDMPHGETHQLGHEISNTGRRILSDAKYQAAVNYGLAILKENALSPNVPRDNGDIKYVGDQVVSVLVRDGGGVFSVVVRRQG